MAEHSTFYRQVKEAAAILGTVVTLVSAIVALYVTSRLAPVVENLNGIAIRVDAMEKDHGLIKQEIRAHEDEEQPLRDNITALVANMSAIKEQVEKIDKKLDTLFIPVREK